MSYSNGAPAAAGASGTAGRSRRDLIDRVRYPNPIPQPPYPPKLLNIPADPARYANPHFADRLASQHLLPVIVDAHGGMPIDLANFQNLWEGDLSEVVISPTAALNPDQLDDADAFLLQDFASALPSSVPANAAIGSVGLVTALNAVDDPSSTASLSAAAQHRHAQALGPGAKSALGADEVTWLRRTEYLGVQQRHSQTQAQQPRVTEHIDVSRDAQLAKIEQSFKDAQKPMQNLVHPNKRGVKAVQVFDFLPDPETWATEYQVVRFIDHPGRVVNGVPQADPRLDVALFRPTNLQDGEQRVSYYLPAGEELPDDAEAPMSLLDNREIEELNARRLRKRRRTGKYPAQKEPFDDEEEHRQQKDSVDQLSRKDYSTPFKFSRDYVPKDAAETAHDVLVLTLDDAVPDPDPDADVDPIKGVKRHADKPLDEDDEDDLFGEDEDQDTGAFDASDVQDTLPPQSGPERQRRSRRSASTKGKERDEQPIGEGISSTIKPRPRAYYHKVGMRFTLRVWRSRFTNNEKLRNRDRRYPGKWDALVLSHRELAERERLRRLHIRSQVDDVGELDPYEESDVEEEQEEEALDGVDVEAARDPADVDDADDAGDSAEGKNDSKDRDNEDKEDAGNDDGDDDDDDGDDDDDDDDEDDEEGSVDGDEELAALRAEAQDAGEDLDESTGRRSRTRRTA
ncbi:Paf1-domain-containing protein, partial [Testicularia cyperi]